MYFQGKEAEKDLDGLHVQRMFEAEKPGESLLRPRHHREGEKISLQYPLPVNLLLIQNAPPDNGTLYRMLPRARDRSPSIVGAHAALAKTALSELHRGDGGSRARRCVLPTEELGRQLPHA